MASSDRGVWGIDIGQCALKALRCTLAEDGQTVVADAFDFIEYPKILSQPEAEPDQLIRDALQQFNSRNDVRGDKVAISVSGQAGLARFIKLPPVESKKIPDIVKYEARQQIPFPLDEVIWDYQQLAGGSEEEGFTLETEVGLFAMKRDQVFKSIRPFDRADMELDVIQLSPLCIYNVVCHDFLTNLPPPDEYDPDDPPESVVVISLGTDTTDLVVTNGYRVWQRSIPLGGNHFTRALTKEMKLTFAKAEHLKRNAREAEDPKKVFQAMRPVFNDLVTEVQRSISYFQSIDRRAKIGKVVAMGNAMRLPGLQQYLAKNLGYEVREVPNFPRLTGQGVIAAPAFRDNLLSYAVCYGLCLQGLGEAALSTNLLPRELIIQRLVREKKPWALATVAVLLLGLSFNFFFLNRAWRSVDVRRTDFDDAITQVDQVEKRDGEATTKDTELVKTSEYLKSLGDEVVGNSERRLLWPELLTSMTVALPHNPELAHPADIPVALENQARPPEHIYIPLDQRRDLHIVKVESEFFSELAPWYNEELQKLDKEGRRSVTGGPASSAEEEPAADEEADAAGGGAAPAEKPSGPGWVIELQGYHDFGVGGRNQGAQYVRDTLLKNLRNMVVDVPIGPGQKQTHRFTLKEMGISHPILVRDSGPPKIVQEANPDYSPSSEEEEGADPNNPSHFEFERCYFLVQFAWKEKTVSTRLEEQREQQGPPAADGTDLRVAKGGR